MKPFDQLHGAAKRAGVHVELAIGTTNLGTPELPRRPLKELRLRHPETKRIIASRSITDPTQAGLDRNALELLHALAA